MRARGRRGSPAIGVSSLPAYHSGGLTSNDLHAQQRRAELLAAERQGDSERLLAALRDPESRWWAARLVADLGVTEAVPDLTRLLDAADPHIRCVAIRSLARLRAGEAADRLLGVAAEDETDWVRSWAIAAVGELGAAGALGERDVVPLLCRYVDDPSHKVRASAAHALGVLADPRALEPLREAWKRERGIKNRYRTRPAYRNAIRAPAKARRAASRTISALASSARPLGSAQWRVPLRSPLPMFLIPLICRFGW